MFQDDKKFYQLELVNRETGFNKVFNSSANVGVINPLIKVRGLDSSDIRFLKDQNLPHTFTHEALKRHSRV